MKIRSWENTKIRRWEDEKISEDEEMKDEGVLNFISS
jgi:hypothetical protein